MKKKTVVFDFDGVIHSYKSGWKGIDIIPDKPTEGIKDVIEKLRKNNYEVVIVSTRTSEEKGKQAIEKWLEQNEIVVDRLCKEKPPALVYVDDRAICFDGNCDKLVDRISSFKSWVETNTSSN